MELSQPGLPEPIGGHAFLEQVDIEPEWIVPGLIPEGTLGMLAGPPGSAKTFAVMRFLADATHAGHDSLLLEEECSGWDLRRRLRAAKVEPTAFRVLHQQGARLDDPIWVEHLKRQLEGVKLAILDPLSNLHGLDDREQNAMVAIWGILGDLQRSSGATLLVVHHTVKTSWVGDTPQLADIRGSSVIAGRLDWAYVLKPLVLKERTEEPEEELQAVQEASLFELHCVKMRGWSQPKARVAELQDIEVGPEKSPALVWADASPKQVRRGQRKAALRQRILAVCRNGDCDSANAILKACGTQRQATLSLIRQMKEAKEIAIDPVTRLYKPQVDGTGSGRFRVVPGTGGDGLGGVVPNPLGGEPPRTTPQETIEKEDEFPVPTGTSTTPQVLSCIWAQCAEPRHQDLAWCVKHWGMLQQGKSGDPRT
jgi:hypothetical protein